MFITAKYWLSLLQGNLWVADWNSPTHYCCFPNIWFSLRFISLSKKMGFLCKSTVTVWAVGIYWHLQRDLKFRWNAAHLCMCLSFHYLWKRPLLHGVYGTQLWRWVMVGVLALMQICLLEWPQWTRQVLNYCCACCHQHRCWELASSFLVDRSKWFSCKDDSYLL